MGIIKEERFDFRAKPNETIIGVLHVDSGTDHKIRGELYSDSVRIETELARFSGMKLKLRFAVDTKGLEDGDTVEGNILVASDCGEFSIPVRTVVSSEAEVKGPELPESLEKFAEIAEDNIDRAVRIFRSRAFSDMLPADRPGLSALYRGLSAKGITAESVEEFLIGAELKNPVKIQLESEGAEHFELKNDIQEMLTIKRNVWGNAQIELSTDADFLYLPITRLTDLDFLGKTCMAAYQVRTDRLTNGKKTGRITIRMGTTVLHYDVTASKKARNAENKAAIRDDLIVKMTENAVASKLGWIAEADYADDTIEILDQLKRGGFEPTIADQLMRVRMLMIVGRRGDAVSLLSELRDRQSSDWTEVQSLTWNLCAARCAMISLDSELMADRTRTAFMRNRNDIGALELMFQTNKDLEGSAARRIGYEEKVFTEGSRSPYLYAMALSELRENDALLTKITPFMQQVISFGARKQMLNQKLALRAAFLSENVKEYSPCLLEALKSAYEKWPSDSILEAIVRILLKGRANAPECFEWYERAVEQKLRIVRLFEYYVETLPETKKGPLPKVIRNYFLYNNTLSDPAKASVYANIVRNRQTDPVTYHAYRDKIEEFARKCLMDGRVEPDYAVLYQVTCDRIPDEETAWQLVPVIFTGKIYIDDPAIRSVVVIHRELVSEEVVPIHRGTAYVRIYTKDAQILFEDAAGRRYASVPYSIVPLMEREPYLSMCREKAFGDEGLLTYECERFAISGQETRDAFRVWRAVELNRAFSEEFRKEIRGKILGYCLKHPEESPFDENLPENVFSRFAAADRKSLILILLTSGQYKKAYDLLLRFGLCGIEPELLVRLAGRLISEKNEEYDENLGIFTEHVFRTGKFDERMVTYLAKYFRGSLTEMLEIRKYARAFFVDTRVIDERILFRSYFTGTPIAEGPAIFTDYTEAGANEKIVIPYLTFRAASICGTGETISPAEAQAIADLIDNGVNVDFAMKIALLKFYSEQKKLSVHEEVLTDALLDESMRKGIRLAFYQNFSPAFVRQYLLEDKVFVETLADPDDTVILEYTLTENGEDQGAKVHRDPMNRVFSGIFSREFVLFYGEVLNYTIHIIRDQEEIRTESGSAVSPKVDFSGKSAYQRINTILFSLHEGKKDEAKEHLEDYLRAKRASEILFGLEGTK